MATIDSKSIIDELIANKGHYYDDAEVAQIVEYTNAYGNITWGVTWVSEPFSRQRRYEVASEFVINPKVIYRKS